MAKRVGEAAMTAAAVAGLSGGAGAEEQRSGGEEQEREEREQHEQPGKHRTHTRLSRLCGETYIQSSPLILTRHTLYVCTFLYVLRVEYG